MIRWLLDLVIVSLLSLVAGAAMVTFDGPLRVVLVLPVILFVPGYALLSALFPEKGTLARTRVNRRAWGSSSRNRPESDRDDAGLLGNIERFVLSIAISLALVSLIVFGLNFTIGFGTRRIAIMVFGLTGSMIIFAIARRIVLAPDERYALEFDLSLPLGTTFVGMFAVSLLVLAASVGVFAFMEPVSQPFTGFTVVAENESTGNMTVPAADDAIVNGRPVTILLNNSEGEQTSYTIVVASESVENGDVTDREVLERFTPTVDAGTTKQINYDPPDEGADRIAFYLYKGDAPKTPSRGSTYRMLKYSLSSDGSDESTNEIASPSTREVRG